MTSSEINMTNVNVPNKSNLIKPENLQINLSEITSDSKTTNETTKNELNAANNQIASKRNSITNENHPKSSIYLKKLKTNYYERKLLDSLIINSIDSSRFNLYAENSTREYTTEFNILNKPDQLNSFNQGKEINFKFFSLI